VIEETKTSRSGVVYGAVLLVTWCLFWLSILASCETPDQVRRWVAQKAERLARCQMLDPASADQAKACLGQFAQDRKTETCAAANAWIEKIEE
jgi:hypothetical protein